MERNHCHNAGGRPPLGVLVHPAVVHQPDGDGVEEVQLVPAAPLGHDQAGVLEHPEVLHDADAGHRQPSLELAERLPVLAEQLVEQAPSGGVGESGEYRIHHDAEHR